VSRREPRQIAVSTERAIRILILTSPTTGNVYLVNHILQRHDVVGMIIESPPAALTQAEKRLRRRSLVEKHGITRTINKLAFNWYRSRFVGANAARTIAERFFPDARPVEYQRQVPTAIVANINDSESSRFIQTHSPDLIAVCGTSVIKPEVFTLAPKGAVNIHTGITPEYRSADPIFWAIYNNEPDKVGVTIHFVDKGIDTGAIIHQESVPIYRTDSLTTIYARCIQTGARLYSQALDEIGACSVQILNRGNVSGKAYYSINLGILQYLVFLMRFRRLRRALPAEGPATAAAESPS
jgi:methionyl-tRNA formyltransferase